MLNPAKTFRRKMTIDAYRYASASFGQIKSINEKENILYIKGLILSGVLFAAMLTIRYNSNIIADLITYWNPVA